MPVCAVRLCRNYAGQPYKNTTITFHRFPADPDLANRWKEIIRRTRNDKQWRPPKNAVVCSAHFSSDVLYFTKKGLRRLQNGAVPSRSLQLSESDTDTVDVPVEPRSATTSQQNETGPIPEARKMIVNVYSYLQTEYEYLKSYTGGSFDLSPLANILKRTAKATGVSEDTVTAVLERRKRSMESTRDAVKSKRAKFSYCYEDEDVSSEEESSCESTDEAQKVVNKNPIDIEEHALETLKVEIEESDDDHSDAVRMQVLSTQKESSTYAEVKKEPDVEVQQQMASGESVEHTPARQDQICKSTSAAHRLCSNNLKVKSKDLEDGSQDMDLSSSTTQVEGRPD